MGLRTSDLPKCQTYGFILKDIEQCHDFSCFLCYCPDAFIDLLLMSLAASIRQSEPRYFPLSFVIDSITEADLCLNAFLSL